MELKIFAEGKVSKKSFVSTHILPIVRNTAHGDLFGRLIFVFIEIVWHR